MPRILRATTAGRGTARGPLSPAVTVDPVVRLLGNAHLKVAIGPHGMVTRSTYIRVGRGVLKGRRPLGNKLELFRGTPAGQLGCLGHRHLLRGPRRGWYRREQPRGDRGGPPAGERSRSARAFRNSRACPARISPCPRPPRLRIDFDTGWNWNETHLLLKAAFPVSGPRLACGSSTSSGAIYDRPTHPQLPVGTPRSYEVPAAEMGRPVLRAKLRCRPPERLQVWNTT